MRRGRRKASGVGFISYARGVDSAGRRTNSRQGFGSPLFSDWAKAVKRHELIRIVGPFPRGGKLSTGNGESDSSCLPFAYVPL